MHQWITGRKRIVSLLSMFFLLFVMAFPVCAQEVEYNSAEGILTVSCERCTAGGEYTLLFLRDGAGWSDLNAEDICFIDQLQADEDGKIQALFVQPAFEECQILLGGVFADGSVSPVLLGSSVPEEVFELNTPAMLSVIEEEAFAGGSFTHVYLGENVTDIGSKAFGGCADLKYIYIPSSTTAIANDAFDGCSGFTIGCHDGSYAQQYAVSKGIAYRLVE